MKGNLSKIRIFAFALIFALCFPAFSQHLFDEAGLLSSGTARSVESRLSAMEELYGFGMFVVTTPDCTVYGSDVYNATENYFSQKIQRDDALIFFISMSDRAYDLDSFGERAQKAFSHSRRDKMEEAFLPSFADNNWEDGILSAVEVAEEGIERWAKWGGRSDDEIFTLIIIILVVIGVSLIVCIVSYIKEKAKLSNVAEASEANLYAKKSDVVYTVKEDKFSHTTTKTISNSSSSSGSRSGGGGGHSHHGGHF